MWTHTRSFLFAKVQNKRTSIFSLLLCSVMAVCFVVYTTTKNPFTDAGSKTFGTQSLSADDGIFSEGMSLKPVPLIDNRNGQSGPYNLTKLAQDYSETGDKTTRILKHLNGKKNGVFLEAGAYDGEEASVSLGLELHHGWTGILVEPVPWMFNRLKSKNRRAFLLEGCISPQTQRIKAQLTVDIDEFPSSGALKGYPDPPGANKTQIAVTCYPIMEIIKVAGIPRLDVLFLDLQGPELDILRTIPFSLLDVTLIGIENAADGDSTTRPGFLRTANDILGSHGYKQVDHIQYDYIFMKT